MNQQLLETFRANNIIQANSFQKLVSNKFLFNLFLFKSLPMGFIAGLRIKSISAQKSEISVPFKWLNQNPFGSTYFAVLAMAAEMSSGILSLMHVRNSKPSISMLVTHLEAEFIKKATGVTTFNCLDGNKIKAAIEQSILTGEGQITQCEAKGISTTGEVVAIFKVTWSFKARA